jgi:DNA-binding response OmpR family regulator
LKRNENEIKLSPKETALLKMLCEFKNSVLPREKALKEIWKDDNYFTGRSMDVYITKLRKLLAIDSNIEIINLHGNGYSLQVK